MKTTLALSVIAYFVACCLPALDWRQNNGTRDVMLGIRALGVGWSGIFAGVFAWYANPLWFVTLVLAWFRRPWFGSITAVAALLLALTVFSTVGRELPGDESNVTKTRIVAIMPGAYVWMASIGLSLLGAILGGRK